MDMLMNRREMLAGVAALSAGAALMGAGRGAAAAAGPIVPGVASINHLHIEVSDVKRSVEFYGAVYGAKPAGGAPGMQTMILPGARPGFGSWLSLSTGRVDKEGMYDKTTGKPGHFSHVGFGVTSPISDFPRIADEIKKRFPAVQKPNTPITEQAGQEIYIFDPDGVPIQMIPVAFNAWGEVSKAAASDPIVPGVASINHLHIEVSDVKKSVEFYGAVYGATPAPGGGGLMIFPGARPGFGSWVNLTTGRADTEGKYDRTDGKPGHFSHIGLGVTSPIADFPQIAQKIKARFPNVRMPNTPITEQAGQEIYIFDPDGLPIQLIPVGFNAW